MSVAKRYVLRLFISLKYVTANVVDRQSGRIVTTASTAERPLRDGLECGRACNAKAAAAVGEVLAVRLKVDGLTQEPIYIPQRGERGREERVREPNQGLGHPQRAAQSRSQPPHRGQWRPQATRLKQLSVHQFVPRTHKSNKFEFEHVDCDVLLYVASVALPLTLS